MTNGAMLMHVTDTLEAATNRALELQKTGYETEIRKTEVRQTLKIVYEVWGWVASRLGA